MMNCQSNRLVQHAVNYFYYAVTFYLYLFDCLNKLLRLLRKFLSHLEVQNIHQSVPSSCFGFTIILQSHESKESLKRNGNNVSPYCLRIILG